MAYGVDVFHSPDMVVRHTPRAPRMPREDDFSKYEDYVCAMDDYQDAIEEARFRDEERREGAMEEARRERDAD